MALVALVICIAGLFIYAVFRKYPDFNWLAEVGRDMFWVGLLVTLVRWQ